MPYFSRIALCCAALAFPMARAADTARPKPAAATDAGTRVPALKYHSAISGYQSFREQKLAPWREVNDDVYKAGGHIGIFGGTSGKPAAQHQPGRKE